MVKNYAEKAELSKCSWYPQRKLGVTMHFSEIINLQFGKKMPYIALYFAVFFCCLIISEKCVVTPIFFLDFDRTC